jgi:hypothetical protein
LGKIAPSISDDCYIQAWRSLDTPLNPIHGTGKNGWDRFNATHTPEPMPLGTFHCCEVIGMGLPRLVAMWQPIALDLRSNQPVNYLVYFHPFHATQDPYPFGNDYLELGRSYLGNPRRTVSHMAHQGIRAIGVVPIFPLNDVGPYQSLTMTQVYRLIREVNFFLQMRAGAQLLSQWRVRQPVGKVAICAFSASIAALTSILGNRGSDAAMASEFFDQKLMEVYGFDPVVNLDFLPRVAPWFRKGDGGRRFRLYTEFGGWLDAYATSEMQLAGQRLTPERWDVPGASSREWHGPGESFTFAYFPQAYVQPVVDIIKVGGPPSLDAVPGLDAHHFFPAFFMGHALAGSSLR